VYSTVSAARSQIPFVTHASYAFTVTSVASRQNDERRTMRPLMFAPEYAGSDFEPM
jgi:hypothetical protein